jgi:O-antigen/teichoic acid export membrane protein
MTCGFWGSLRMRNSMETSTINKTRIAKNTALLYFRMLLLMLIGLYTTRVTLNVLGASDLGTFTAVAGVVMMLGFLNSTMATASQRFFAMELGVENHTKLKQVFTTNVLIFIGLALAIFILAETIGLWYINHVMEIPPERFSAAAWIYQFAIFTFMASIVTTPYLAIITARERMQAYAYISILEVILKLAIVFMLLYFPIDKLKLYGVLLFAVQILISTSYILYSTLKFPECKIKYYWNKAMFKEVFGFAGWTVMGTLAITVRTQGIILLLNKFFGVLVNAAQALAYQVYNSLIRFTDSFFTAVRPQIIKSYSVDNEDKSGEMMKLVFQSSKFCFYLILVLSIPILIETQSILVIWLKKDVPEYTVVFTRLLIINAIIESLAYPLITSIQATGKIKRYQIVTSSIILLIVPISYLLLRWGAKPQGVMYVMIVITIIAHVSRIYFMNSLLKMNLLKYFKQVIFPISSVTILGFVLPLLYSCCFDPSFWRVVGVTAVTAISSVVIIYFVGLTKSERNGLKTFVLSKIGNKKE